jgi:hypothetical protein
MVGTNIVCPNCSCTLKTAAPLAAAQIILCRRCGTKFSAQSGWGAAAQAQQQGTNWSFLFGSIIGGGALLLLLGSVAVIAYATLHYRSGRGSDYDTGARRSSTGQAA